MITREDVTLKNTGMIRKLDSLGRIVIPMELKRRFGIGKNDV
jgi:transcriptional pleiotropic regulator of transition state genes